MVRFETSQTHLTTELWKTYNSYKTGVSKVKRGKGKCRSLRAFYVCVLAGGGHVSASFVVLKRQGRAVGCSCPLFVTSFPG